MKSDKFPQVMQVESSSAEAKDCEFERGEKKKCGVELWLPEASK